jgi:predicted metalloprotease with PDZ domain
VATKTPGEALENSGWKLVYDEQPNEMQVIGESLARRANFVSMVGMTVSDDGTVGDVIHGGPAYVAGLAPGMKIAAVNGEQYSPEGMRNGISAAKTTTAPIQLIVANGAQFRTFSIEYHEGIRYPHIVRNEGRPDYLDEITHAMVQDGAGAGAAATGAAN